METFDLTTAASFLPIMDDTENVTKQLISSINMYNSLLDEKSKPLLLNFILTTRLSNCAKLRLSKDYNTIEQLVDDMDKQLLTKKSFTSIQQQLLGCTQNKKTIDEYGRDIENLFVELTIAQSDGDDNKRKVLQPLNEKTAINRFATGLKNSKLSAIIAARTYTSLKDAIRDAKDEEAVMPKYDNYKPNNKQYANTSTPPMAPVVGQYNQDVTGRGGHCYQYQHGHRPPSHQGHIQANRGGYNTPPHHGDGQANFGGYNKPSYLGDKQVLNHGGNNKPIHGGFGQSSRGGFSQSGRGGNTQSGSGGHSQSARGGHSQSGRGGNNQTGRGGHSQSGRGGHSQSGRGGNSQSGSSGHSQSGRGEYSQSNRGGYSQSKHSGHNQPTRGSFQGGHHHAGRNNETAPIKVETKVFVTTTTISNQITPLLKSNNPPNKNSPKTSNPSKNNDSKMKTNKNNDKKNNNSNKTNNPSKTVIKKQ